MTTFPSWTEKLIRNYLYWLLPAWCKGKEQGDGLIDANNLPMQGWGTTWATVYQRDMPTAVAGDCADGYCYTGSADDDSVFDAVKIDSNGLVASDADGTVNPSGSYWKITRVSGTWIPLLPSDIRIVSSSLTDSGLAADSEIGNHWKLMNATGLHLQSVRDLVIGEITEVATIATSYDEYLDRRGLERNLIRKSGEDDETYRTRVNNAYTRQALFGTPQGMIDELADIGYAVTIDEAYAGTDTWNRYWIRMVSWDSLISPQRGMFYIVALKTNAAHAIPLFDPGPLAATFDDGGTFDDWNRQTVSPYANLEDPELFDDWNP